MTRPELPPGFRLHTGDLLLRLERCGWTIEARGLRYSMVALAWSTWEQENPEWAAYLEQIEGETDR